MSALQKLLCWLGWHDLDRAGAERRLRSAARIGVDTRYWQGQCRHCGRWTPL